MGRMVASFLVHPRLQVVAGGARGLSNFDHITLFTPFAPVGGKYESDTCGVVAQATQAIDDPLAASLSRHFSKFVQTSSYR